MLDVITPDAEDAAHWKARVRSDDRKRGNFPAADRILHFHGEPFVKKARIFS
jgi:hypothetical protein